MVSKVIRFLTLSAITFFVIALFSFDFRQNIKSEFIKLKDGFSSDKLEVKPLHDVEVPTIESENLPKPLTSTDLSKTEGFLNELMIIEQTNTQRHINGLQPLVLNKLLADAAKSKVEDMFRNQYFEHNSPSGKMPSDFIRESGYGFITIGENLALGIFKNETDLVDAWMKSPGHKANILGKFTEIGVSAKKSTYKGNEVWFAVQEFGTPISLCPEPNTNDKKSIEENSASVVILSKQLTLIKNELNKGDLGADYKAKVEEYNKIIKQYNVLVRELNNRSEIYNEEVKKFNMCIKNYTN